MNRIFISYKRKDKERVFELIRQIEEKTGEKCWVDLTGIHSDEQFAAVIIDAINKAEVFLFMYSARHLKIDDYEHDYSVMELNYAFNKHKKIVFVNLDRSPLADWFSFKFGQKQQVFADAPEALNALCNDIRQWLGCNSGGTATIKTVQEAWTKYLQAKNKFSRYASIMTPEVRKQMLETVNEVLQTTFDDWNLYFGIAEDFVNYHNEVSDNIALTGFLKATSCTFKEEEAEMKGRAFVFLGAMYRRTGRLEDALRTVLIGYLYLKVLPKTVMAKEDALYNLYVIYSLLGRKKERDDTVASMREIMTEDDVADMIENKAKNAINRYRRDFGR